MLPETVPTSPPRARRVALLLVGASLLLAAGGALWFLQFASQVRRDPALIYREPATLDKLLKRANDAERAGDRATAITTYRHHKPVRRDRRGAVSRTFGVIRPLEQLVERRRLAIDQRRVPPHLGGELEEPQRAARGEQQAGAHQEEGHAAAARRRRGHGLRKHRPVGRALPRSPPSPPP